MIVWSSHHGSNTLYRHRIARISERGSYQLSDRGPTTRCIIFSTCPLTSVPLGKPGKYCELVAGSWWGMYNLADCCAKSGICFKCPSMDPPRVSQPAPSCNTTCIALSLRAIIENIETFQISHVNAASRLHSIVSAPGDNQYACKLATTTLPFPKDSMFDTCSLLTTMAL